MSITTMMTSTSTSLPGGAEKLADNPMERRNYARARGQPESLQNAPRCQGKTRAAKSCRSPAVKRKRVCHKHGGAKGSGAPKGEANGAFKHGGFTAEAIELRREVRTLLNAIRDEAGPAPDGEALRLLEAYRELLGGRELTRAEKRERNQATWSARDRTRWGGEDRRGWPKHPGRNGYRGRS